MSKLIDKLKRVSEVAPQPMGFRRVESAKNEASLLFVAKVTQTDIKGLADYVTGADAALLAVPEGHAAGKALQKASQAALELLWGCRADSFTAEDAKKIAESGGDFIVLPADSALLDMPKNGGIGRILEVEGSTDERLLRTVDELPVDAVLVTDKANSLTWLQVMRLRLIADLFTKPLLASVPAQVTASELQMLWEAGVDGVVIETTAQSAARLEGLHKEVRKLNLVSPRKQKKPAVLVPRVAEAAPARVEEEEEEEPE